MNSQSCTILMEKLVRRIIEIKIPIEFLHLIKMISNFKFQIILISYANTFDMSVCSENFVEN